MNLRDLINTIDILENSQLNETAMAEINKAIQGLEGDDDRRFKVLAQMAQKYQVPGLYDPVGGGFIDTNGSKSFMPPSKDVDMLLASKGLVSRGAKTSSGIGSFLGISGDKYDQEVQGISGKANADAESEEFKREHIQKIYDLTDKLNATIKAPAPAKPDVKPTPNAQVDPNTITPYPIGQKPQPNKNKTDWAEVAGAGLLGAVPGTIAGPAGALASGGAAAVTDYMKQRQARSKSEGKISIAKSLIESFDYEAPVNEYSFDQFKTDAGDTLRGAEQGATFGFGNEINAGVQSLVGPGKYKDYLAKQIRADQEAVKRNPNLYGVGQFAGAVAPALIPGVAAVSAGRLAGAAAKAAVPKLAASLATKPIVGGAARIAGTEVADQLAAAGLQGGRDQAAKAVLGTKEFNKAMSVKEQMKSLSESLQELESTIYVYLDESGNIWDEEGRLVCNEDGTVYNNDLFEATNPFLSAAWNKLKGAGSWVGDKLTTGWNKLTAKKPTSTPPAPSSSNVIPMPGAMTPAPPKDPNKLMAWIRANPKKALALGLTVAGGTVLGANALLGNHGGSGSGNNGGTSTNPNVEPNAQVDPNATTDATGAGAGPTPEQLELIKQLQAEMAQLADYDDPTTARANQLAQQAIDKASASSTPAKPETGGGMKPPPATGATGNSATPPAVQQSMNAVAGAPTQSKDANGNPLYTDKSGITYDASGKSLTPESSDAELARWLKIARG